MTTLATLYTTPADTVEVGDYVRIEDTYEGSVLSVDEEGDDIVFILSDADEYDDRTEVKVAWDTQVAVLAADYSDVEDI
jgi:hypothetical protein